MTTIRKSNASGQVPFAPAVSVIITTHNREEMLLRAVRSVLAQTYQNFELIIVDDGSTDNTEKSISRLQNQNITYIKFDRASGTSAKPRNTGLEIARGKYIAFLDDDDEWLPTLLEKFIEKIETADDKVGVVYCGWSNVNPQGKVFQTVHPMLRGRLWPLMLGRTVGTISSSLIKRECFTQVGLFDTDRAAEPHGDMWVRLAKNYDYEYVPEALARIHIHESQISKSQSLRILRLKGRLKKYADDYLKYPEQLHIIRSKIGLAHLIDGERLRGFKYLPDILRNNRSFKFYVILIALLISPGFRRLLGKYYRFLFKHERAK
jgi:glycosyltransferase involved in cell wall biosynthesis